MAAGKLDPPVETQGERPLARLDQPQHRLVEQPPGALRLTCQELCVGSEAKPLGAAILSGREPGGALEEGGRSAIAAAPVRTTGAPLQLRGHGLIRRHRGGRQVPRAAVGVELRIDRRGQRRVRLAATTGRVLE